MKEKTFGLDLKDRKILSELDKDCRQPNSTIAKKVGLSTEVVSYRIKRLEQEKIITQYQVALNLSKLGVIQFRVLLSFQHITSGELEKKISKLKENKNVKWLVSCNGAWDLVAALETDSVANIDSLKNEVLSAFSGFVSKKAISISSRASVCSRSFILDEQNSEEKTLLDSSEKIDLEDIDIKILKQLSENARKSAVDIATELNTTARIIAYRIKQMIKLKLIQGFRIAINYEKLGIQFYKGFVYLDNPEKTKIQELTQYLKQHKNVIHHVKVISNWDLEPEFEVTSEEEFNKILTDIKDKFSDIIKNIDIITISKEHKFVYF
ncbi:Lrp/AsnC family transcriptional regulator [archaeon]|jgi:DNA-binding Lrp family transcriptional regulator|nr:Lrp/AsnC family transcriptional regulator [archaeon]